MTRHSRIALRSGSGFSDLGSIKFVTRTTVWPAARVGIVGLVAGPVSYFFAQQGIVQPASQVLPDLSLPTSGAISNDADFGKGFFAPAPR